MEIELLLNKCNILIFRHINERGKEPSHIVIDVKYRALVLDEYYNCSNYCLSRSPSKNELYMCGLTIIWAVGIEKEFTVNN